MADAFGRYLDAIGRVPLLSAEDERALARTMEAGRSASARVVDGGGDWHDVEVAAAARAARERMVLANQRLVVSIARRYPLPVGIELADLVQAGNQGLHRAVDRYDWRLGFRFSTYATRWIVQALGRTLDRCSSAGHVPMERVQQLRSARRGGGDLGPDLLAVAGALATVSLDAPSGMGSPLGGALRDDGRPYDEVVAVRQSVANAVAGLPGEARRAVALRFGLDGGPRRTYAQIARDLDTPPNHIPGLMRRALGQLKEELTEW